MQQITLPKVKLDDFISLSSYIDNFKTAETIPITTQIKIEVIFGVCYLTKTNCTNFVIYSFDTSEDDIQMLINEETLKTFLSFSKGDKIQIIEKEKEFIINDGYFKPSFPKEIFEFNLFPETPKVKSQSSITLDKKLIAMLNVAKQFVSKDELRPTFLYVHIKNDMIFSSNLVLNYTNKIDKNYGDKIISLSTVECKLLSNFETAEYFSTDNHNILKCGDITYGSTLKQDVKDMSETFLDLNSKLDKEKYCRFLKSDLFNFCNSTIAITKKIKDCFVSATFSVISANEIKLDFRDEKANNSLIISSKIQNIPVGFNFAFNQDIILKLLSELEYDEICISPSEIPYMIGIWSDNDDKFLSLTTKMQNL